VKSALVLHGLGASALAARLDKQLAPIPVEGSDVSLPIERHGAFFRSLVHVFRNAVDHGIETSDERVLAGKPAEGVIRCDIGHQDGKLEILIADDGRGVDRALLEDKLITAGMDAAQARKLSLEDLVFRDGLSSRNTASAISGRGVGLAAVRNELEAIGGAVTVETRPGAGTRFRFRLAIGSETPADAALEMSIP
jgi:chemotaxis protein histidine kinase CheA